MAPLPAGNPLLTGEAVQYGLLAGSTAATAITGKNPLFNLGIAAFAELLHAGHSGRGEYASGFVRCR